MNPIDARIIDALRRQESAVEVTGLELGWVTGYYDPTTGAIADDTTTGLDQGYMWIHKDDVLANNVIALIGDRMWKDHKQAGRRCWVGYIHGNQRVAYAPLIDQISTAAGAAGAISYAVSWTSTGTAPALGNGTLTAEYLFLGRRMSYAITLIGGSTTTFGTGGWRFDVPVPLVGTHQEIVGYAYDSTAGTFKLAQARFDTTTTLLAFSDSTGAYSVTVPFTWADGDILKLSGWYGI